jgi:hypothetical protein
MTIIGNYSEPATTHTPGPWNSSEGREIDLTPRAGTAYRIKTIEIQIHVKRGTWKTLAFIPADEPEAQVNARLIVAAPAMLDELAKHLKGIEGIAAAVSATLPHQAKHLTAIASAHRAVIARATGTAA